MLDISVCFVLNSKLMVLFEKNFLCHCGADDFQWFGTLCALNPAATPHLQFSIFYYKEDELDFFCGTLI